MNKKKKVILRKVFQGISIIENSTKKNSGYPKLTELCKTALNHSNEVLKSTVTDFQNLLKEKILLIHIEIL